MTASSRAIHQLGFWSAVGSTTGCRSATNGSRKSSTFSSSYRSRYVDSGSTTSAQPAISLPTTSTTTSRSRAWMAWIVSASFGSACIRFVA